MKSLDNLKSVIEREIDKVTAKGEIAPTEIKAVGEAVDILKDIETICAMKEYGQEDDMYSMENRGYSTRRMSRTYPAMYRDSYENRSYNSYDDMYYDNNSYKRDSMGRYSRHSEKEEMIDKLERKLKTAQNEQERRYIMECIEELERN